MGIYPYLIGLHYKGGYMGYPYRYFAYVLFGGPIFLLQVVRSAFWSAVWHYPFQMAVDLAQNRTYSVRVFQYSHPNTLNGRKELHTVPE